MVRCSGILEIREALLRWIDGAHAGYNRRPLLKLATAVVVAGAPGILVWVKFNKEWDEWLKKYPVVAFCLWLPILIAIISKAVADAAAARRPDMDVRADSLMLTTLERIVGHKRKALEKFLKARAGATTPTECVVSEAIQPESQIRTIAHGMQTFVSAWMGVGKNAGVQFQVVVAKMENGRPVDWFEFWPENQFPRSTAEQYKDKKKCGWALAAEKRKLIIVPSTKPKRKGNRFQDAEGFSTVIDVQREEEGSMLCFPICGDYGQDVPYVVSIRANKANVFRKSGEAGFKLIFGRFASRILLEHYAISALREVANHELSRDKAFRV